MKTQIIAIPIFLFTSVATAQIDLLKKVEDKATRRLEKNVDKTIDKELDKAEQEIKKDQQEKQKTGEAESKISKGKESAAQSKDTASLATYGKYDFIPGDKIIFEDEFLEETLGEFPSRWKLIKGAAENVNSSGQKGLGFLQNSSQVSPNMSTENFLPSLFTIEFDVYFYAEGNEMYSLRFGTPDELSLRLGKVSYGQFHGEPVLSYRKGWHHIAIAVNDKKMKVYFNETRVLNIPEVRGPLKKAVFSALTFGASKGKPAIIKSVRIAEGGMDLYKRIVADGKYIARGILFDVNKSTLKPTSMGPINEMVKLMKEYPDLKFSIEGHTDSDGETTLNQQLSEERARSVKSQMVNLGIESTRLESKGFGESKPADTNSTAEGKANNRRVEFVKK